MTPIKIITNLPADRWPEYKTLRLTALKTDPLAFGSTYEEELIKPNKFWQDRVANPLFQIIAVELDGQLIGMLAIQYNSKPRLIHWVEIHGVYVKTENRGQGVALKLLEAALDCLSNNKKIKKAKLTVVAQNKAAVELYRRLNFGEIGVLKGENFYNGIYYDELAMEKIINT